jgi:hypothetical protein
VDLDWIAGTIFDVVYLLKYDLGTGSHGIPVPMGGIGGVLYAIV